MDTACIRVHFYTIKYPMQILCILRMQIIFMISNLRRGIVTAALHFSLRTTSNRNVQRHCH